MNAFKKTILAVTTIATLAIAASAPAQAGWKKPLAYGIGAGIALGVADAVINGPRRSTVYVERRCSYEEREVYNSYGEFVGYRDVKVCY